MKNAVIVDYARSPFTPAHKGELRDVRPDDLAAQTIKALVERTKINKSDIDDLILGCAFPEAEQGLNVARLIVFLSGLPITVPGMTLNRFCGSSMQSVHIAAGNIASGMGDLYIAAGVESMSRIPMTGFNPMPNAKLYKTYPRYESMGITAENLAKKYKIKRERQEEFAVSSHKKASDAQKNHRFDDEIIVIKNGKDKIEKDGCVRADTTLEKLATLKPAFDARGLVTAGTSSPLTDGAAALIIASEEYADKHKLNKTARIKSYAVSGCAPEIMGIGPVSSTNKALKKAGLKLKDIDLIELNEAFAAQSLAVIEDLKIDMKKLNLDGGAIALGHPLGASGARITGKAAKLLQEKKLKYALATMCIGGGQGVATILERIT